MAEGQTDSLYDFIYVDYTKISSFYSQIFHGSINKIVQKQQTTETRKSEGGFVSPIKGVMSSSKNITESHETVIDPKDMVITDTLSRLMESSFIERDESSFQSNKLCLVSGDLYFVDNYVVTMMIDSLDTFKNFATKEHLGTTPREFNTLIKAMKKLLLHKPFQPAFVLASNKGTYCGTYKEEFLHEAVISLYLKHGLQWIDHINIVGIYEGTANKKIATDFLDGANQMAEVLRSLISPPDRVSFYPIAIFRKLG